MFVTLGFWALLNFLLQSKKKIFSYTLYLSCALGFMIKGFPALVPLIALFFFIAWSQQAYLLKRARLGWGGLIMAAIIAPWFVYMIGTHGEAFTNHILTQEVEGRVIDLDRGNPVVNCIYFTFRNFFYYLKIIWNNLAPWTLFLFAGLPYLIKKQRGESREAYALTILLSCVYAVFFLYVFIALQQFNVQYMLTLAPPAAILCAHVVLKPVEDRSPWLKALGPLRKFVFLFLFSVGYFVYAYLNIFFSGLETAPLVFTAALVYGLLMFSLVRRRDLFYPPLMLALLILLVISRMSFFERHHLTQNSVFKEFAAEIHARAQEGDMIAIGETIDPMKFRVYFDVPLAQGWLTELLPLADNAFIVVTERQLKENAQDLELIGKIALGETRGLPDGNYAIIRRGKIMAKKMSLDAGFFKGLLLIDRPRVRSYLFEDIYLIEKSRRSPERAGNDHRI
jgi:4-amino-4-deoxy-L-arabinose transferase-like glycosyltransferase